jgi:anti-anti-sigma factor
MAIAEIDRATAPAFSADLQSTIDEADTPYVVVDCSGVTFMDSAGYHALVDATAYAVKRGRTLVIRDMSPNCTKMIRLCDHDHDLHFET